jgi:hypothetical protein
MGTQAIINAALAALNAVLGIISEIRGQSGENDTAILAAAVLQVNANDQFIATVTTALAKPVAPAVKT